MDRGLLWASGVSALGLAAMGAVAILIEPPLVDLAQLPERLGATVSVDGDVVKIDARAEGWSRMRLRQGNDSVEVIADAALNVSAGDRVRVTGQVGTHAGRIQISLESASDVVLLRPWREHHVPLSRVLAEPWHYAGTHIRTSGLIEERVLYSDHKEFGVPLRGFDPGSGHSLVEGLLEYEAAEARFQLRPQRIEPLPGTP